jgi:hypothetical protein
MKKLVKPSLYDPVPEHHSVDLFDSDRINEYGDMLCVASAILPVQADQYWNNYLKLSWCYSDEGFEKKRVQDRYPILGEDEEREGVKYRSVAFTDTPKCLYRFLYLWRPRTLDFSDMYKSRIALIDLKGAALASLKFYKYELAAYFYVPGGDIIVKPVLVIETPAGPLFVSSGIPGIEDDSKYRPQLVEGSKAEEEIQAFITLLEMQHEVYSGNNFRV